MFQVKDIMPFKACYAKILTQKSVFKVSLSHMLLFLIVLQMPKF